MKKFFLFAVVLMMGMNVMAYDGKAYAWPNTTTNGTSLAGGVYVSYKGNEPSSDADYLAYDNSSQSAAIAWMYTAYFAANANNGYAFLGWYSGADYSNLVSADVIYDDKKANNDITIYALFAPTTVDSVVAEGTMDTIRVAGEYTTTIQFAVTYADAVADFDIELIGSENWNIVSSNVASGILSVTVKFTCDNAVANFENSTMISVTSKGTSTGLEDGEKSYLTAVVKAVGKLDPATIVYTYTGANEYKVDDTAIDLAALWTSNSAAERVYTLVSYTESGINNEGGVNPVLNGAILFFGKAGKVVVRVEQAAMGACLAGSQEMEIAISKYTNSLTWKFEDIEANEWTLGLNDGIHVYAISNYAESAVVVEQISGDESATYYEEQDAIYTSFIKGEVMLQANTAEDYLYEACASTAKVIVTTMDGCNLYSSTKADTITYNSDPYDIYFDGIPAAVTFNFRKYGIYITGSVNVSAIYAESSTQITSINLSNVSNEWQTINLPLDANVIGLRFEGDGLIWGSEAYIKNIEVKSASKMEADKEVIDFGHCKRTAVASDTIWVDWITCDTMVRVESNLEHITFSVDSIDAAAHVGQTAVVVYYSSDEPETVEGKVVVYTPYESAEILVMATTDDSYVALDAIQADAMAAKQIRNGQLYIRVHGKIYNAIGVVIE